MPRGRQPLDVYMCTIVRRWIKEVSKDDANLIVVSPYLTSQTAERVLLHKESGKNSEPIILTNFSVEVFANGASHLPTLKRLLNGGCRLYHVDDLHAKVVLGREFASVGSQNLTQRGGRNKEATIAVTDPIAVKKIRNGIENWRTNARPIDLEMIDLMEQHVRPLKRRMSLLKKDFEIADDRIEKEKTEVERKRREEEAQRQRQERAKLFNKLRERSHSLRDAIAHTRFSASMNVTVKDVYWEDSWSFSDGTYNTMQLSNPRVNDMRRWIFDGELVTLERGAPYLIILEETGRLALVIVKKVQTADFGTAGYFRTPLKALGRDWFIGVEFASDVEKLQTWNVKFILTLNKQAVRQDGDSERIEVLCYFNLRNITVVSVKVSANQAAFEDMVHKVRDGDTDLLEKLANRLLDARRFSWYVSVTRPEAFFEGLGNRFRLRLRRFNSSWFLTARKTL